MTTLLNIANIVNEIFANIKNLRNSQKRLMTSIAACNFDSRIRKITNPKPENYTGLRERLCYAGHVSNARPGVHLA
jgi:hypothetical protein